MNKLLAVLLTTLFISACGGGGGGDGGTPVAANNAPTVNTTTFTVRNDQIATGSLNVTDADGDTLTAVVKTQPAHGVLTVNNDFTYSFDPVNSYVGADSIVLTVSDGKTTVDVTISITIQAPPADAALTVSAVAGDATINIGATKQYTVTIADADGIQTLSVQLLNASDAVVKDLPYTNTNDLYTITLDATGLTAEAHKVRVKATGVDGGTGTNSAEQTQLLTVTTLVVPTMNTIANVSADDNGGFLNPNISLNITGTNLSGATYSLAPSSGSITSNLTGSLTIDPSSGNLVGNINVNGSQLYNDIIVRATLPNGNFVDSNVFTVTVNNTL